MEKYKIFTSGVQKELKAERRAVKDFILLNIGQIKRIIFEDCYEPLTKWSTNSTVIKGSGLFS